MAKTNFVVQVTFKECVKSRLWDNAYTSFKQASKIFEKNLSIKEFKALNSFVRNKGIVIQKAGKADNIVILNRSDYIWKLSKISYFIHMEERIIHLLKSLQDQGEIFEKEKIWFISIRF